MSDLSTNEVRPGPRLVESIADLAAAATRAFADLSSVEEVQVEWVYPSDTLADGDERVTITIRRSQRQYGGSNNALD